MPRGQINSKALQFEAVVQIMTYKFVEARNSSHTLSSIHQRQQSRVAQRKDNKAQFLRFMAINYHLVVDWVVCDVAFDVGCHFTYVQLALFSVCIISAKFVSDVITEECLVT